MNRKNFEKNIIFSNKKYLISKNNLILKINKSTNFKIKRFRSHNLYLKFNLSAKIYSFIPYKKLVIHIYRSWRFLKIPDLSFSNFQKISILNNPMKFK